MRRPTITGAVLLSAMVAVASSAEAGTATGTLSARVEVIGPSCQVTGDDINFGTYTSGQTTSLFAAASINFANCGAAGVKIELDGGQSGEASARKLKNGSATISYNLFQDAGRTAVFGSGANGVSTTADANGAGKVTVYGRLAGRQNAVTGTYTDSVGITVTF